MASLFVRQSMAAFPSRILASQSKHTSTTCSTSILFGEPPLPPQSIQSLLKSTLSRAKRTVGEKNEILQNQQEDVISVDSEALFSVVEEPTKEANEGDMPPPSSQRSDIATGLLSGIASRAQRTLSTRTDSSNQNNINRNTNTASSTQKSGLIGNENPKSSGTKKIIPTDLRYNQNPAVSLTALAHFLWSTVLRPHEDSAIDATCGNGYDSVGIASILFGNEDLYLDRKPQLICIDVQEQACQATKEALLKVFHPTTIVRQVQILTTSHAPLALPNDPSSVGLVVYNLGYLPSSAKENEFQTQVQSTLASITDALLLVRVGGMVSVMTYPRTNHEEDFAVRALLEATVYISNSKAPKWYAYVDDLEGCDPDMKALLTHELRRISSVYEQSNETRTFRVTEHKKIGLTNAPILMTATRIK